MQTESHSAMLMSQQDPKASFLHKPGLTANHSPATSCLMVESVQNATTAYYLQGGRVLALDPMQTAAMNIMQTAGTPCSLEFATSFLASPYTS